MVNLAQIQPWASMDRMYNRRRSYFFAAIHVSLCNDLFFSTIDLHTIINLLLPNLQDTLADARSVVATMHFSSLWIRSAWPLKGTLKKLSISLLLILIISYQSVQSYKATFCYPNDTRNPYAYVPTSRNIQALSHWIEQLQNMIPQSESQQVTLIGTEFWPLPWFLKNLQIKTGSNISQKALLKEAFIISMPAQTKTIEKQLATSHQAFNYTLRSQVVVCFYLRNDIWEQWKQPH